METIVTDPRKMSRDKMLEAICAVEGLQAATLAEWKEFSAAVPRRMNASQRERSAYLRGRLAGLHQAYREFEKRSPIEFFGS